MTTLEYGFKINKIVVTGINKEEASLEFDYGLNVISGASDTGKTYIFQAINYLLGGSSKPKEIIEADGYSEIYLEIEDFNNNIFTLKRNISNGKMFYYKCRYDLKDNTLSNEIIEKHDKNNNNISTLLLNLFNCTYKNVVKNKDGVVQSFSFRDFARLCLLDEEKIISEKSIVLGSAGRVGYTANKNAFKTILTGKEDKGKSSQEDKKLNNLQVDSKIEILDRIIFEYYEELKKIDVESQEIDIDQASILIENIEKIINEKKQLLENIENKRNKLMNDNFEKESYIQYNKELINKFTLLKKNYESDYERIEFIDEANFYVNQLNTITCPICSSKFEETKIDIESIKEGINAERRKLLKKITDIDEVMEELLQKIKTATEDKTKICSTVDDLTNKMSNELKPLIDLKINELKSLLDRRDEVKKKVFLESQIEEKKAIKDKLLESKESINVATVQLYKLSDTSKEKLCEEVANLLNEWGLFKNPDVIFDLKTYDLIINKKKKSSFGKGYRALINSAFAIAVMRCNLTLGLPNPKVIILDSPLITFKDKDSNGEKVSEVVKTKFYEYLSKNFLKQQIIILENAEPDNGLQDQIKYYHFSKNSRYGRYGFFPTTNP